MRTFLLQNKTLIACLIVMVGWLLYFPAWRNEVTRNPLDEAITLSPKGEVSREIRIVVPESYVLALVFERGGLPFDQLTALIGDAASPRDGRPIPRGVNVPIRWEVKALADGAIAASGQVDSHGANAWSGTQVERALGRIQVAPGRYRFTAQVLRDVPELAHLRTHLVMRLRPKSASTWQIGAAWWGSIANVLLVLPAAIIIGLLLIVRAGKAWRMRRRSRSRTA